MSVEKEIERLKKEATASLAEAARLEQLRSRFPDLAKVTDRHRWERLISSAVVATEAELRHSCGCCSDAMLRLYLYLDTDLGRVYSSKSSYVVGEKSTYGDTPKAHWKETLEMDGVPPNIIQMVSDHFTKQKQEALRRLEDSFQEHESFWENETLL